MITTQLTHTEWNEPDATPKLAGMPVYWCISLVLHGLGLAVLWFWLGTGSVLAPVPVTSTPVNITLKHTATRPAPIAATEPTPATTSTEQAPVSKPAVPVDAELKKDVTKTATVTRGQSGLFRYDNNVSVSAEAILQEAEAVGRTPTQAFDPRVNKLRKEAQRLANLAPAVREETIKTKISIAGQTLVRTEAGCAVLLELQGASRLDGPLWAGTTCGGKNASDKFADRLSDAIRNDREH